MTSHPRITTIAALGSSFAAGPTLTPVDDVDAMRSARNYPHLLAASMEAELVDLTVSGATTATILHTPQQTMTGRKFAPQIEGLPPEVDLVTITAGGNDLQFLGSMLFTAWNRHDPDGPLAKMLGPVFAHGLPHPTADDIERTATGLAAIVHGVRERAPHTRVVLVDYLTVVTEHTPTGEGKTFAPAELQVFRHIQEALAQAYLMAADRSEAELLSMSTVGTDHALGSEDPWVIGFQPDMATTAGSFHPNEAGMQAVADHLRRMLG